MPFPTQKSFARLQMAQPEWLAPQELSYPALTHSESLLSLLEKPLGRTEAAT
jgi:hypothetical protein